MAHPTKPIGLRASPDVSAQIRLRRAPAFHEGCQFGSSCWPVSDAEITSGDVVAIFFTGCGKVADCPTNYGCSGNVYPIKQPKGWGGSQGGSRASITSAFRVCKNAECSSVGGVLKLGEYVW